MGIWGAKGDELAHDHTTIPTARALHFRTDKSFRSSTTVASPHLVPPLSMTSTKQATQKRKIKPSKKALEALASKAPEISVPKRPRGRPRKIQDAKVSASLKLFLPLVLITMQESVDKVVERVTSAATMAAGATALKTKVKVRYLLFSTSAPIPSKPS